MSVRTYLNEHLRPVLPPAWVVYDFDKTLTNISKVTVIYVHQSVEPAPHQGGLMHTVQILVVDPTQAETAMENHLDDHLEDLIPLMQALPQIEFQRAEKATRDGFPCYAISLQIRTA
jgi:hypothetical protein